jgi:hypothetical protein
MVPDRLIDPPGWAEVNNGPQRWTDAGGSLGFNSTLSMPDVLQGNVELSMPIAALHDPRYPGRSKREKFLVWASIHSQMMLPCDFSSLDKPLPGLSISTCESGRQIPLQRSKLIAMLTSAVSVLPIEYLSEASRQRRAGQGNPSQPESTNFEQGHC